MKKVLKFLMLIIITSIFISGCGKTKAEKTYDAFLKVPLFTNIEVAVNEWGKDNVTVLFNTRFFQKYRWDTPDGCIFGGYTRGVLWSKAIDFDLLFTVAKDKGLLVDEDKLPKYDLYDFDYEQVKKTIGTDGIIAVRENGPDGNFITYIWFSKSGKLYYKQNFKTNARD